MAGDTSLWPVALGGILALAGTGATAAVTIIRDFVQHSREVKIRRADKFEELVAAAYEFDQWVQAHPNATTGHRTPADDVANNEGIGDLSCLLSTVRRTHS